MEDLVQPSAVLPSAGTLSNQGRVGRKDHALPDTTVPLATDLAVVELHEDRSDKIASVCSLGHSKLNFIRLELKNACGCAKNENNTACAFNS